MNKQQLIEQFHKRFRQKTKQSKRRYGKQDRVQNKKIDY